MLKAFQIITDGSCDLTTEYISQKDLISLPFYVSLQKDEYLKERVEVRVEDVYKFMIENDGIFPKTSMPSVNDYLLIFEDLAKENKDIIVICIAKDFSGSYNSATLARDICLKNYPDTKITIIDSMSITVLQGLLVKEIVRMKENNLTYDEIVNNINEIKKTGRIFFTIKNLDYLQHGGRIGKITAIIGNTLRLNPIITFKDGSISSGGVSLNRKRALLKISDMLQSYVKSLNAKLSDFILAIGYGHSKDEGQTFLDKISSSLQTQDIHLEQIGATISVHTGPYPIGVGLIKKYDA